VFITPSIPNKNGGDRLQKMSISSVFEEEILENCRFWEVQTSGFRLCIIYPNYLSCFKVVPEPGQRNWTISSTEYGLRWENYSTTTYFTKSFAFSSILIKVIWRNYGFSLANWSKQLSTKLATSAGAEIFSSRGEKYRTQ
jgi:hypothetical protein